MGGLTSLATDSFAFDAFVAFAVIGEVLGKMEFVVAALRIAVGTFGMAEGRIVV